MSFRFQITALPLESFSALFDADERALAARNAVVCVADSKPGCPCRVSLQDAEIGERLILLPFTHHDTASPYRASGPVYVRVNAEQARPAVGEVPEAVRRRLHSVRAYDAAGDMIAADAAPGTQLESIIEALFADPRVEYLHLHNAKPGCYSCRVDRVPAAGS